VVDASSAIDAILVVALRTRATQIRIRRGARGTRVELLVGRFVESAQWREASELEPFLARLALLAKTGRFHVRSSTVAAPRATSTSATRAP
jgi:hypothetical protein